jgi:DNA-binding NarL/FixJ family response regulator
VILVDDAPLVREGFAGLLASAGVDVVEQLADASELLQSVDEHKPDVVIMDVRMPPTGTVEGLRAAIDLKRVHPHVGVLLLSQHVESRHAEEFLAQDVAGVGYLLKERVARPDELVDAVARIADGGTVIDPEVVSAVFGTRRSPDPLGPLTERERDVLQLVAEGCSNEAISERLFVTSRTVETHMANIFTKLGLAQEKTTHRRVLAVLTLLRARARGG